MRESLVPLVLLVAGCEKDLLAEVHDAGPDAPPDAAHCTAPTTDAHAAAQHTLLLVFDGVTLSHCSKSNSQINCSENVQTDTAFPPFMDGDPARDSIISSIVSAMQSSLAPYSIDIVTARPPAGNYYMTVIGGAPALIGAADGVGGLAPFSCTFTNRNTVSLLFEIAQWTPYDYANSLLNQLEMVAGLPATSGPPNDCACFTCTLDSFQSCTFGVDSPISTDPQFRCGLPATALVDEPALLEAALGCR